MEGEGVHVKQTETKKEQGGQKCKISNERTILMSPD